MKRCPTCNQTYTDDALTFCVNDGAVLIRAGSYSSYDPQATIMAPPPSVTEQPPPPPSFGDAGSPWSSPSSYSPPSAWNAPGGWQQPIQEMPPPGVAQPRTQQPQQGLAIASLICGVLSITFGLICGGPVMSVAAIVLGIVALVQIKNDPSRFGGKGLAIGGIAIGALWLLFGIFFLLIMIISAMAH